MKWKQTFLDMLLLSLLFCSQQSIQCSFIISDACWILKKINIVLRKNVVSTTLKSFSQPRNYPKYSKFYCCLSLCWLILFWLIHICICFLFVLTYTLLNYGLILLHDFQFSVSIFFLIVLSDSTPSSQDQGKKCWPIMLMFCISCANFTQFPSHFLQITVTRGHCCITKPADNRRQLTHLDSSILWCVIIWKPHRRLVKDIQLIDFNLHVSETLTQEYRAMKLLVLQSLPKIKSCVMHLLPSLECYPFAFVACIYNTTHLPLCPLWISLYNIVMIQNVFISG